MQICIGKKKESHWIVKSNMIFIYEKIGLFSKPQLLTSCSIENISYINIYWKNVLMGRLLKYAHPIFFTIHLKDGTPITFEAMLGTEREELIKAIEYLESQNIAFKSEYELLDIVKDKDRSIWQSIEDIIEKK